MLFSTTVQNHFLFSLRKKVWTATKKRVDCTDWPNLVDLFPTSNFLQKVACENMWTICERDDMWFKRRVKRLHLEKIRDSNDVTQCIKNHFLVCIDGGSMHSYFKKKKRVNTWRETLHSSTPGHTLSTTLHKHILSDAFLDSVSKPFSFFAQEKGLNFHQEKHWLRWFAELGWFAPEKQLFTESCTM